MTLQPPNDKEYFSSLRSQTAWTHYAYPVRKNQHALTSKRAHENTNNWNIHGKTLQSKIFLLDFLAEHSCVGLCIKCFTHGTAYSSFESFSYHYHQLYKSIPHSTKHIEKCTFVSVCAQNAKRISLISVSTTIGRISCYELLGPKVLKNTFPETFAEQSTPYGHVHSIWAKFRHGLHQLYMPCINFIRTVEHYHSCCSIFTKYCYSTWSL